MRYFVSHGAMRASNLQMENRLLHVVQDEISDCVITDAALIEFVKELKDKQDEISKREPRLRRVEISAELTGPKVSISRVGWLRIGSVSIILQPVKSIIEL
jgi:hypothetical protein